MGHAVDSILVPVLTGLFGAFLGFGISRLNDWLSERRTLRRAVHHLMTEVRNVRRHFEHAIGKMTDHPSMPAWRKLVHLETCRFYGNGLGSFDTGMLRLLDEETAGQVMYLMLMIRNNNAYIDQAKAQVADESTELFVEVCDEFIQRCALTMEMAAKVGARIDDRYHRHRVVPGF